MFGLLCCRQDDAVDDRLMTDTVVKITAGIKPIAAIDWLTQSFHFKKRDKLSIMQTLIPLLETFLSHEDRVMLTLTCTMMRDALTEPTNRDVLHQPVFYYNVGPLQLPEWRCWHPEQAEHLMPIYVVFCVVTRFSDDRDIVALTLASKMMRDTPRHMLLRTDFQRLRWFGHNRDKRIQSHHEDRLRWFGHNKDVRIGPDHAVRRHMALLLS